jgi:hypothetical protein
VWVLRSGARGATPVDLTAMERERVFRNHAPHPRRSIATRIDDRRVCARVDRHGAFEAKRRDVLRTSNMCRDTGAVPPDVVRARHRHVD